MISKYPLSTTGSTAGPYHPSLKSLYSHYISTLCDVCFPFTHDLQELEYVAAARWPGFVQPVLEDYRRQNQRKQQRDELFGDELETDEDGDAIPDEHTDFQLKPPTEDVRMRLIRLFTPSLSAALETLYPRLTNAADWAVENAPESDLLEKTPAQLDKGGNRKSKRDDMGGMELLPRMSKFILVAAFLASTNPAKSDIRMFGRGLDEKKRKRRVRNSKAAGKTKGGPAKVDSAPSVTCIETKYY
jgi:origin recognition complex subunit 5